MRKFWWVLFLCLILGCADCQRDYEVKECEAWLKAHGVKSANVYTTTVFQGLDSKWRVRVKFTAEVTDVPWIKK